MDIRWITRGAAALDARGRCGSRIVACGPSGRTAAPDRGRATRPDEDALVKKAHAIHDKVIALDTHNDISPANFTAERNYTQRLDTQVNLPKMVEGGLDASFFIVYVGQGPLTPEGYDSRLQAGGREVRRGPSADRADRARQDRAGADRRRRAADQRAPARRSRSSASRTAIRSATTRRWRWRGSRSSTIAARATCRWPTTATASSPTRTPASAKAGSGTASRRSASRSSPR